MDPPQSESKQGRNTTHARRDAPQRKHAEALPDRAISPQVRSEIDHKINYTQEVLEHEQQIHAQGKRSGDREKEFEAAEKVRKGGGWPEQPRLLAIGRWSKANTCSSKARGRVC